VPDVEIKKVWEGMGGTQRWTPVKTGIQLRTWRRLPEKKPTGRRMRGLHEVLPLPKKPTAGRPFPRLERVTSTNGF